MHAHMYSAHIARRRQRAQDISLFESLEPRQVLSVTVDEVPTPVFTVGQNELVIQTLAVDINNDGHQDLITLTNNGEIGVLRGKGDGTFRKSLNARMQIVADIAPGEVKLLTGDFDGDGDLDLAVINDHYDRPAGGQTYTHTQYVWRMLNSDGEGRLDKSGRTAQKFRYPFFEPEHQDDGFALVTGAVTNADADAADEIIATVDGQTRALGFVNGRLVDQGVFTGDATVPTNIPDFDEDDSADTVNAPAGYYHRFVYVSLSSDHRPVAESISLVPDPSAIQPASMVSGSVVFQPNGRHGSSVKDVAVFLDLDNDGVVESTDLRIYTVNTAQHNGSWQFRPIRTDAWGTGRHNLLIVAENNTGEVSTPAVFSINLV